MDSIARKAGAQATGFSGPRAAALLALAVALMPASAPAQSGDRTGAEVVASTCAACHLTGEKNAPKIGDKKAWGKLATQGLSSLTEVALKGIREMPAHGGSPSLTDTEIARAVTYMVNRSGGHWIEPINKAHPAKPLTGEQVVKLQCAKCHEEGLEGAPKIGDKAAWIPRLKNGFEATVLSAANGHGAMPARGGLASLSDAELRDAIIYMFQKVRAPAPKK